MKFSKYFFKRRSSTLSRPADPAPVLPQPMRLLIVQFAGDYREAAQRLASGGMETYYAQKYSVDAVAALKRRMAEVAVLCSVTDEPYDEVLETGVRAIGAGLSSHLQNDRLVDWVAAYNPTHLVLRSPFPAILRWAVQHRVPTLTTFAESVSTEKPWYAIRNYRLARLLNHPTVEWVGCYGITSARLYRSIGVNPEKIIPWQFITTETPAEFSPKTIQPDQAWHLLYIGTLSENKGVGDLLNAVALLRAQNRPVYLKVAGKDPDGLYNQRAQQLGIADCVEFLGLVSNDRVIPLMQAADAVLVPSRHQFVEGFPLVITHALCARTPVVISDHPMFRDKLKHRVNGMVFPAGNSAALAHTITELMLDPALYSKLSQATESAWQQLQLAVHWAELIQRWLSQSADDRQWIYRYRLASGQYQ